MPLRTSGRAVERSLPLPKNSLTKLSLLKGNPRHPSLNFKRVAQFWSVRVGLRHRAVDVEASDGVLWFWIGTHADYGHLID